MTPTPKLTAVEKVELSNHGEDETQHMLNLRYMLIRGRFLHQRRTWHVLSPLPRIMGPGMGQGERCPELR
jgi:hypothetical protein